MPKTIKVKVYQYNELDENAQQKAQEWWIEAAIDYSRPWEIVTEDAQLVGLNISSLDPHRGRSGCFQNDGLTTAKAILKNHGKTCETYQTAKRHLPALKEAFEKYEDDSLARDEWEEVENDFLDEILQDYGSMWQAEYEYQNSEPYIVEGIEANGYTFTKDGKRFG